MPLMPLHSGESQLVRLGFGLCRLRPNREIFRIQLRGRA